MSKILDRSQIVTVPRSGDHPLSKYMYKGKVQMSSELIGFLFAILSNIYFILSLKIFFLSFLWYCTYTVAYKNLVFVYYTFALLS